tara:strand:+ start:8167 stop:9276 length:1110 start_codon:yes stop_codon:yes gene_type:complete
MNDDSLNESSILSEWWKQIDKWLLISLFALITSGFLISFTINPKSISINSISFLSIFSTQHIYLIIGLFISITISMLSINLLKKMILPLFVLTFLLLLSTLFIGQEWNGSKRWINLNYFTIMPIEFIKPFFCLALAFFLESRIGQSNQYKYGLSILSFLAIGVILIIQPDISQFFLTTSIFVASIFISGFSFWIICFVLFSGIFFSIFIYFFNFNVKNRIDSFLWPDGINNYQPELAKEAINSGGLFGVGPGNGTLKINLPEAYTDYIYAVIAEEFGVIGCIFILFIFLFIAYRVFIRLYDEKNHFLQISLFSLIIYFSFQALIHISVNISLTPSTGMTLPFISYGGSSIIGISITFGLIMLLSKKRHI